MLAQSILHTTGFGGSDDPLVLVVDTTSTKTVNLYFKTPFRCFISWGDGSFVEEVIGAAFISTSNDTQISHTYSGNGPYTIQITGRAYGFGTSILFASMSPVITRCLSFGSIGLVDLGSMFRSQPLLVEVPAVLPPTVRFLDFMFAGTPAFNQDISSWDVSNVTSMEYMFYGAPAFNQDISSWDVSNVISMFSMFFGATAFNQPLNNWDVSNVTNMSRMFFNADVFNQDISSWDVSSVTNMREMFLGAHAFNQPLNNWDVSNVTNMSGMFLQANAFNQPLNNWDVSSVKDMEDMFASANTFNQPLNNWDVSSVTNMREMFYGASAFNQNLSSWVTGLLYQPVYFSGEPGIPFTYSAIYNQPLKKPYLADGVTRVTT